MISIERIEQKMKEFGIKSWRELSRRVGVSASYLGDIKNGRTQPSLSTLQSIANELQTSVGFLLGDIENNAKIEAPKISRATLDLEAMVKDLVYEYPDLALGFRDTRENWAILPEEDKQSIADGLMTLFYPDANRPTRLRDQGRKGQV